MQVLMTIENEELRFYSFELGEKKEEFNNIHILNDSNLTSLYDYYLDILDNPNKVDERLLIEKYLSSLKVNLDTVINISRSLADFDRLTKTKAYPYEVIVEGMNNQKVFSYFCDHYLLHFDNKTYVKK